MSSALSRLTRVFVFCVCGFSLYRSGRLALADTTSATCLPCASRIEPSSELYVARTALARDSSGDVSGEVDTELRRALALNSRDSAVLRSLGTRAELRGEARQAENFLLQAATVDHTFLPQWSLANFYLRTDQVARFWPAVRSSLAIIDPKTTDVRKVDPEPIFDLCWRTTSQSKRILAEIPSTRGMLLPYLRYLVKAGRVDAAVEALPKTLALPPSKSDLAAYLDICEFLLSENQTQPAVQVWNRLLDSQLIQSARLDPRASHSLADPDFSFPLLERAFGWQVIHDEKIFSRTGDRFLSFEIGRTERDHFQLLSTVLPVLPGRGYRLTWHADPSRLELNSRNSQALTIHILTTKDELSPACAPLLPTTPGSCAFTTSAGTTQVRLVLRYDRPPGGIQPEGELRLTHFALEAQP
jgi:tetratricopeptide (TPR) repeat protein